METLIVKENGTETVKANLKFRVLMNRTRLDGFAYETYAGAVQRMNVLKNIFKYSRYEITVVES